MTAFLTNEEITDIYRQHGFGDDTPVMTNVGFRNQVYLGDRAVLKVYPEDNGRGYLMERWFLETAKLDCIPKLYAAGKNWILMERIHGTGLFRLWRDMTDDEREETVKKIAAIARSVSETNLSGSEAFLSYSSNYRDELLQTIRQLSEKLCSISGIPEELLDRATSYVNRYAHVLDDDRLYLVYNDLHFDNLLVTDSGRVILLDFEMLEIAPKDLVLDVWQRMLIHPFTYANEEDHPHTHRDDYRNLLIWMQRYAPSLFAHPEVRRRVNLFGIRYELDILCDYPMAEWPIERLRQYLNENLW